MDISAWSAESREALAAVGAAFAPHFLDPDAPDPARGRPAGELVPARFRAKARTWRERHQRDSIETRHTKCAAEPSFYEPLDDSILDHFLLHYA
ncbi:hypothetical protein [Arthrobacter sp. TB 26]|uniref:hypothetical protein n=1 Tax=Arthrobacter sp. TB 26 TaxID=494420 RepID=UPI00040A4F99|tara:strand:- start:61 stop:342 length:282 start_codon:yes stop_codon:yes gene_type:complete